MKHNTHIYIAIKAIEFCRDAIDNLRYESGRKVDSSKRAKVKRDCKELQRLLRFHQDATSEASWAPDDVINDKSLYHTFKLFTDTEFDQAADFAKESYSRDGTTYYRTSGGGGLPFKVDHLARCIADMAKLRDYNDHLNQKQIMYFYLLISHYVVDAHVPMHCDIRDDPPSTSSTDKPPGKYFDKGLHSKIEKIWEDAVTPVALGEEIVLADTYKSSDQPTELSSQVEFRLRNQEHRQAIKPVLISERNLMKYMVDLCIQTKKRSMVLFPVEDPDQWSIQDLSNMTRQIFADAIASLISIWIWMWSRA